MSRSMAGAACPPDEVPSARSHTVVGLGASDGGIRALEQFFRAVEPNGGIAYIVVLQLALEHESRLVDVLRGAVPIPVTRVRRRVPIEPDHIYVVAAELAPSIAHGHIEVAAARNRVEERRAAIDMFFRALAAAQRARAVAVILSGTGAHGSMGMKRIREFGGICIAQEPSEADCPDMPRNAIAAGLVDHVLPAAQIPQRLAAYDRQLGAAQCAGGLEDDDRGQALGRIVPLLRERTGHDFANYRRSTLLRRIERRMRLCELCSLAAYATRLRENDREAQVLLRDLLVSVTHFFRDPDPWRALERRIVPRLFEGRGSSDHVRVWVAGCATGEEAYSIAMLLAEHAADPITAPSVQVFATDIDKGALLKARAGLYAPNDCSDLAPERLQRFFVKQGDAYRVRRELREMILFAPHDILADPPFSHLDLVICRNLLIYLDRTAQQRILRLFHFALRPEGVLFLGDCESVDEWANGYVAAEEDCLIYRLRTPGGPSEAQRDELDSSGGELQARSMPSRSASEERATTMKEMRSLDHELNTVNQELRIKIDELSEADNDTRNLMNSTLLATVFVDRDLRVKLFTPCARSIFALEPGDAGRRLTEITHGMRYPDLVRDIEQVLDDLPVVEREVSSANRRWYIARILPYRTAEDRIAGAVLTFTDITERKRIEEELEAAREQLEARVSERTRELAEANEALRREAEERIQTEEMRLGLLRQVVRAQEDERRRVSRELHDQLGQEVTALALKIAALKATSGVTPPLRAQIEILEQIVKRLDNDVDFLVWELRPTGLDDLGLAEALSDHAASWSKYFGVPVRLESRLEARLPAETETVLYRIAQEALNNVAKHARATAVQIVLERQDDHVSLTVQDNGIGFDPATPVESHSLGLIGMRERAALVGGSVSIDSGPGGTTIRVRVPG